MTDVIHKSVLPKEVLQYLDVQPNENIIDGTVGEGGHAIDILAKNGPDGMLMGIDADSRQVENARIRLIETSKRVILQNDSYVNMREITVRENFRPINGILLDLGYSSWQIEQSKRGFSFSRDEKLDMRYNLQNMVTAEKVVNEYSQEQLERIIEEYGEDNFAKQIARKIVEERQKKRVESTLELKDIIQKAVPPRFRHQRISFATRTFQALRIEVNGELSNLKEVLPKALEILSPGGRLVIISFHSLEDRLVKNFFKDKEDEGIVTILTKKPVTAGPAEITKNPRARSAKLRAIVKI